MFVFAMLIAQVIIFLHFETPNLHICGNIFIYFMFTHLSNTYLKWLMKWLEAMVVQIFWFMKMFNSLESSTWNTHEQTHWSNIRRHGTLSSKGIPSLPCDKCLKFSSPLATWKAMAIFVSFPFFSFSLLPINLARGPSRSLMYGEP